MSLRFRPSYLLSVAISGISLGVYGADLEGLRVWSGPESTRVVLDLSSDTAHRVFLLEAPNRVVIDLKARVMTEVDDPLLLVPVSEEEKRPGHMLLVVGEILSAEHRTHVQIEGNDPLESPRCLPTRRHIVHDARVAFLAFHL